VEQPQTDQPAQQSKKHRMSYAERRNLTPNSTISQDDEKKTTEIKEHIMKLVAQ
jgi:hypothetical protein